MTMMIRRVRQWSLAALVAASLGFGATQVVAAPAEAAEARACDPVRCDQKCKDAIPGSRGVCVGGRFCDCLLPA
jgi:hypothetical protein